MRVEKAKTESGFSIVEMIVTMLIMLAIMGLVTTLFSRSLSTKSRESSKTDALTAAQAALNVMSREIANSGYGMTSNGVLNDSAATSIHFVTNHVNTDDCLGSPGENITYYWEPSTQSILRHDANGTPGVPPCPLGGGQPLTSIIINRISSVEFKYYDYIPTEAVPIPTPVETIGPTPNTGRVRIRLTVNLEDVVGQVRNQSVQLTSDVALRNSDYMLRNY